ncbi:nucleoside recognition domain-containing protein [Candidatus Epulonipiscium viviparus]|uniref:nucleoside recognition domain-containing protein n=1 Tax=Candidatus Epulonipiscium viviparus TaxID=420336 RepID=UPI00016BFCB5|nr:nucleoside recognition domain-containing protein [Candidatus Epulopiscium viviparus]
MLNYLWSFMCIFSVVIAMATNKMNAVTTEMLNSSVTAVKICFDTTGILCMWMGIMYIAEKSGLVNALSKKMTPLLNFLFPDVPKNHPARKYIATNMIANFLGLGWAATPPGLLAMVELQKLNKNKSRATNAMCMFLIINISSIQLIPITMVSYRNGYGSANSTEIVAPAIIATLVSTIVAIAFAKFMHTKEN